ncbi:hypothetical protein T484DRAFT_1918323, partial [Baffinella frigidus]
MQTPANEEELFASYVPAEVAEVAAALEVSDEILQKWAAARPKGVSEERADRQIQDQLSGQSGGRSGGGGEEEEEEQTLKQVVESYVEQRASIVRLDRDRAMYRAHMRKLQLRQARLTDSKPTHHSLLLLLDPSMPSPEGDSGEARARECKRFAAAASEARARECERFAAAASEALMGSAERLHASDFNPAENTVTLHVLPSGSGDGGPDLPPSREIADELKEQAGKASSPLRQLLPELLGAEDLPSEFPVITDDLTEQLLPELIGAEDIPSEFPAGPGEGETQVHAEFADLELFCRAAAQDVPDATSEGDLQKQPLFVARAYEALRELKEKAAHAKASSLRALGEQSARAREREDAFAAKEHALLARLRAAERRGGAGSSGYEHTERPSGYEAEHGPQGDEAHPRQREEAQAQEEEQREGGEPPSLRAEEVPKKPSTVKLAASASFGHAKP